jgi:hypothetical protein
MKPLALQGALLALALFAAVADAQGRRPQPRWFGQAPPHEQRDDIGPGRAASLASRATGSRVMGVTGGTPEYRVKVLEDGRRVRTVRIDARTGKVLE